MTTRGLGRTPMAAGVAIGAALLLGGCSAVPPGAAAVVDGTRISRSDVQELADAQCASLAQAAKSGQGQTQVTPRKQLVEQALSLLMDIELSLKFARSQGVQPRGAAVSAAYGQVDPLIASLPAKYHSFMRSTFHRWAEAQDVLVQVGQQATGQQQTSSNSEALLNAGYQKRQAWLKGRKIDTDPRFGPARSGYPGSSDPSVSKAVSSFAKGSAKSQPDAAWVSQLPSNQKCG